ncbi:MAG: putative porin, partial [Saprospiraceae bacterium]|nr:putative porin [Saprospiraceae bacterium]
MHTAHRFLAVLVAAIVLLPGLKGQTDSTHNSFKFYGDARFRAEQDWDSRKSDGTFRDDRSRMRIRARAGMTYQASSWLEMGAGIRTGNPGNQQDPNITFGLANNEYSAFAVGVHKAYLRLHGAHFSGWLGKNTFPFETQNELFWSSAVYPEGATIQFNRNYESGTVANVKITAGHYIATASNRGFGRDGYLHGLQTAVSFGNRLRLIPGLFLFRNMADIPDGKG